MNRLAIVGDKKRHAWVLKFSEWFNYTRGTEFTPTEQRAAAWEWLQK
jgi:hypothetical protein